jgi:hypothetical protein
LSASSAAEAEALGQQYVDAVFGGISFRVPLDVDTWPLHLIRFSRGRHSETGQVMINYRAVMETIQVLTGDQFDLFVSVAPTRAYWVPFTESVADAVGFGEPGQVFGGLPRTLAMIDAWPDKVESDLRRFWRLEYRDRYRTGRRRVSLRQIHTCLSNLPTDSAIVLAMNGGKIPYTATDLLLMDLYESSTGTRHPSRPMSAAEIAQRDGEAAAIENERAKYRARQEKRTATGLETARANARNSL